MSWYIHSVVFYNVICYHIFCHDIKLDVIWTWRCLCPIVVQEMNAEPIQTSLMEGIGQCSFVLLYSEIQGLMQRKYTNIFPNKLFKNPFTLKIMTLYSPWCQIVCKVSNRFPLNTPVSLETNDLPLSWSDPRLDPPSLYCCSLVLLML